MCVEKNPHYVAVGQRLLPEATWICGDVFDVLSMGLGRFDTALANPPFILAPHSTAAPAPATEAP
ncbi:hypothetical protein ABZ897_50780 [Nonomuraea sp. NPDC046802]|uniref:hypothetical protein n=1 Tax=Nonomuraea sp. NPDC046802 TaxID=3154919 RepID=UPI0033E1C78A